MTYYFKDSHNSGITKQIGQLFGAYHIGILALLLIE